MKIVSAVVKPYARELAVAWQTPHGIISQRRGFIIRVVTEDGLSGFGEASPLPGFSRESMEQTGLYLFEAATELLGQSVLSSLSEVSHAIAAIVPADCPSVRFCLETALCDLAARREGKPLALWLNGQSRREVPVNYLLGASHVDWDNLTSVIGNYQAVKIKMSGHLENDIECVRKVRQIAGKKVNIRIDANRCWNYEKAAGALEKMQEFGIEYVEEPVAAFDVEQVFRRRDKTGVRIALDEALVECGNPEALVTSGVGDVVIVKPTLIGGIWRIFQLASFIRSHNQQIVITSSLETEVGLSALLHLAAAIDYVNYPCGLDTLRFFKNVHEENQFLISSGSIRLPDSPGIGIGNDTWDKI